MPEQTKLFIWNNQNLFSNNYLEHRLDNTGKGDRLIYLWTGNIFLFFPKARNRAQFHSPKNLL
jgi:hypothetical protein